MKWTRRQFLQLTGSASAAVGLGLGVSVMGKTLKGHVSFSDWRALPGMVLPLSLDIEAPELAEVEIMARAEGRTLLVGRLQGASQLDIEMPFIETDEESFEIYAVVHDSAGCVGESEPVEVLSRPFCFGM